MPGVKLKLGEVLVDAMVAKLKAGVGARITVINAEYNDGLTVNTPGATDYYTSGLTSIPAAPAIIVAEGPMTATPEGSHSFIGETQLRVFILDQDADRQQLGKRLQRLARAVMESAYDDAPAEQLTAVNGPASGQTAAFSLAITGTTPGNVFEPTADDSWRGFYLVTFAAEQLEG